MIGKVRVEWVLVAVLLVGTGLLFGLRGCGYTPAMPDRSTTFLLTTPGYTNFTNLGVDGDVYIAGGARVVAPTAIGTATPAFLVQSSGVSDIFVVKDGATSLWTISDGGTFTNTGAGVWSGAQVVNNVVKVIGPTAVGTATPAFVVDTTGVSNVLEVRKAATPLVYVKGDGDLAVTGDLYDPGGTLNILGNTTITGNTDSTQLLVKGYTGQNSSDELLDLQDVSSVSKFSVSAYGNISAVRNVEHTGLPSVITATVAYNAATGTVATLQAGEVWFIHGVYANVTSNFDCTGDNCTLQIGDGNDANGFLDLVDAELQTADTEMTGATAGWQGFGSTDTVGAYLAQGLGFVYAAGAGDTIDWAVGGTDPAAGSATIYVVYTRVF